MFKNLIQLYSIVICCLASITLMVLLLFSGNNLLYLVFPEYMNKIHLASFDSDEEYLEAEQAKENKQKYEKLVKMSPNELSKKRLHDKERYIQDTKTSSIQNLIISVYEMLIALVFFIIHWCLYKRSSTNP